MADIINLMAESGRNIIGDDSTPVLELENSSTGSALKLKSDPTTNSTLDLSNRGVSASPTIAMIKISSSVASAPAFAFHGSVVVSTGSGTASLVGAVRAKIVMPDGTINYGYIPLMGKFA